VQILVNDFPALVNQQIGGKLRESPAEIDWHSPLQAYGYKEYRDKNFLDRLGMSDFTGRAKKTLPSYQQLNEFWPANGPQWDAFGIADRGQLLLVEAKSHVAELIASVGAKDPCSTAKIKSALDRTKQAIGTKAALEVDWTTSVYQYANRLAHLYFLHKLHGLDAYLVLLCFLNDSDMRNPRTLVPTTQGGWKSALFHQERLMGIRLRHSFSDRIIHSFIDVGSITVPKSR
jgi:hypothetical protein